MHRLKINIAANFAGRMWSAVTSILVVPIYVKFLGLEAYGLVGILATLFAIFSVLDLGLSSALNRHLASTAFQEEVADDTRSTVRSLEIVYWGMGLLLSGLVFAGSAPLATMWIKSQSIPTEVVRESVRLMGLVVLFQWPTALYSGGLQGLQRQVLFNGITIAGTTIRIAGALCLLVWVSDSILLFFAWQAIATLLVTLALGWCLWHSLPPGTKAPRFKTSSLAEVGHFAAGLTVITLLSIILTQMDKVILSRTLPLKVFGYYVIAGTVAGAISYFFQPVFAAMFPQLSTLVAQKKDEELATLYHRSCNWLSLLILPVAAVLVANSHTVLLVWTRDSAIADNASAALALLSLGTALNGLMNLPYALQLAHGWTRLPMFMSLGSVVVFGPLMVVLIRSYGMNGAALVWVLINLAFIVVNIPVMHKRLLVGQQRHWYVWHAGIPLVVSMSVAWLLRAVLPLPAARLSRLGMLFISYLIASAAVLMTFAEGRQVFRKWIWQIRGMRLVEQARTGRL